MGKNELTSNSCQIIKKNPKLQLCRQHVPLEALFLVVGGFIVPPIENAVCTAAILDSFVMSSTPEMVKTHLSSGHEPQGTIDKLEVCFYLKPSLILMTSIKYVKIIVYLFN